METFSFSNLGYIASISFKSIDSGSVIGLFVIILLLISSALISGSEVAFFSLSPSDKNKLSESKNLKGKRVLTLLRNPEKLLATILIGNNFVNIAIVLLSTYLTEQILHFENISDAMIFLIKVVLVTFLLLLFGEIIPKVYASKFSLQFSLFMSLPLFSLDKAFSPLSFLLIRSTSLIKKRLDKRKPDLSIDDLSNALELTENQIKDNKKILEGIVSYGTTDASEIMKPRVDVVAFDINMTFSEVIENIKQNIYSRIPVYEGTLDTIKGVLFVKDLLPHFDKQDFEWQTLIRKAYFVPESKKINDLLLDFQSKKIHMAIVSDEYGGISGIVTFEDVIEEIVGDIADEFDDEDVVYEKIDDNTYIFEGKTLLIDFYKILKLNDDVFDKIRGEADTLAGLILELKGEIPQIDSVVEYKNFTFKVIASDNRRIKKIKLSLKDNL